MNIPIRPFRFSLLTGGASTKQAWIDKVCQAENLGYDSILFSDHVFNAMSPIAALAAAAGVTSRLRLGSYMFGNDFHHPLHLAQDAATIDVLSNGRFDFGLGTGYMNMDYAQLGIPLDAPIERINRLAESIRVIKEYFRCQPFTFEGKYYQIKAEAVSPKPVQRPHPTILMGGGGKRMIQLAAREANVVSFNPRTTRDGWFDFSSLSPEATDQKLQWFLEAAGERAGEIELSAIVPLVKITLHEREAFGALEKLRSDFNISDEHLTLDQTRESPHILVGSAAEVEDKLHQNRERFGISHYVFFEPIEMSMELVQRLAGK